MFDDVLSPAQIAGYVALVLGVIGFSQREDRRFKGFMLVQALAYAIHFHLLGEPSAVAGALISMVRAGLSLYTRSLRLAFAIIVINLIVGAWLAERWNDWLPLIATCIGTWALFALDGIRMRIVMLSATALWLTNNVLVGSIGGIALELMIATANTITIVRLWRAQPPASIGNA